MALRQRVKGILHASFLSAFRLSDRLGLVLVWDWIARMDPHLPGPEYSLVIADEYCRRDRRGDALRMVRSNILAFLGKPGSLPISPGGNTAERRIGAKEKPDADAGKSDCLRDVYAAMEAIDVKAFLAFGTLLGHIRENGFIRNDGDLDLGIVFDPAYPDRIANALSEKGFLLTRGGGSTWPCRIKGIHANGTKVDIIFFNRRNGKFQTYCEYRGRKIVRERACFGLKRAKFQSIPVWVPEHPEAFLDENYLDWRVPQARSHFLFSSALTDYTDEMIRFFALRHLYALLSRGKRNDFEFFLDLFHSRNPSDPFWPEIQRAFQANSSR